jgi:putative holliday junction resolvase
LQEKLFLTRVIGIDYGQKRVGIAVSDPLKIGASGIATVRPHEVLSFLDDYMSKENVECIVVGKPLQMNNTVSESFYYVKQFVASLKKKFPGMRIELIDERFTSKIASMVMFEGGMKKSERRKKENIDRISAAIILQTFLEKEKNKT